MMAMSPGRNDCLSALLLIDPATEDFILQLLRREVNP